jgi:hypothetical protein
MSGEPVSLGWALGIFVQCDSRPLAKMKELNSEVLKEKMRRYLTGGLQRRGSRLELSADDESMAFSNSSLANSTIRMAFFAASPMSITSPICEYLYDVGHQDLCARIRQGSPFHAALSQSAMWLRVAQAFGMGFLFVPITLAGYIGIPAEKSNSVSGLVNFMRNMGSSVGTSMVTTLLALRAQFHQSVLSYHTTAFDPA